MVDSWPDSRKDCDPLILDYWNFRDEVSVENGLLFKGYRLIVPKNLRNKVLQLVHKGHFGIEKMRRRAKETLFWPVIIKDIIEIAQSCEVRQIFSRSQQKETLCHMIFLKAHGRN